MITGQIECLVPMIPFPVRFSVDAPKIELPGEPSDVDSWVNTVRSAWP